MLKLELLSPFVRFSFLPKQCFTFSSKYILSDLAFLRNDLFVTEFEKGRNL